MRRKPFPIWKAIIDWLVIISLVILTAIIAIGFHRITHDDAYITYRYARNLAAGQGFVYNPGEDFLGTTTPLYTILLAVLSRLLPFSIPVIGGFVSALALGTCAIFLYLLCRDINHRLAGGVASLLLVTNPLLILTLGFESSLVLALVVSAFFFYFRGKEVISGCLLALAFITRGEGVLPVVVLAIHYLITRRRIPIRAALAFGLTWAPWCVFSLLTFGSPFPSTLQAKIAQRESGLWMSFLQGSIEWVRGFVIGSPVFSGVPSDQRYLLLVPLILAGLIALIRRREGQWWVLLAWVAIYGLGYSLLDVPFYHWYIIPFVLGGVILVGLGLSSIKSWLADWVKPHCSNLVFGLMMACLLIVLLGPVLQAEANYLQRYQRGQPAPSEAIYTKTGQWLAAHTPPKASVGYFEIGFVGYFSERRIIDPLGLVTRGAAEHVAKREFLWAYQHYRPDYIVHNPVIFKEWVGAIRREPWFSAAYREVAQIDHAGYPGSPLIVYEKHHDAAIPAPFLSDVAQIQNDTSVGEILGEMTVGQTFRPTRSALVGIDLLTATYERKGIAPMIFHLRRGVDGQDLVRIEVPPSQVANNQWYRFQFAPLKVIPGETYYFFLESPQASQDTAFTVWATVRDRYKGGALMRKHQAATGDLTFKTLYVDND